MAQEKTALPENLAGVWGGHLYNDTTHQRIDFELIINQTNKRLSGYTHTTFLTGGVKGVGIKTVKLKESKNVLYIEDEKLIDNNYGQLPSRGIRVFMELHFSRNDSAEILSGFWKTNSTRLYRSVTGRVFLTKSKEPGKTAIIPKLKQLGLLPNVVSQTKVTDSSHEVAGRSPSLDKITRGIDKDVSARKKNSREHKMDESDAAESNILFKESNAGRNVTAAKNPDVDSVNVGNMPSAIIPDTTIVNEEITIYMFPKGDIGVKNKGEEKTKNNGRKAAPDSLSSGTSSRHINNNQTIRDKVQAKARVGSPVTRESESSGQDAATNQPPKYIAAERLSDREIETIRTVEISRDSLVFSLFDNGIVDGDTVSVLLNGKVVMPRVGLLAVASNKTIFLTPDMGDSIKIILYAENLGSIPPNTGLLVIRDGDKNHEIRFSGDLKKNAAIILKRKNVTYE